MLKTIAIIGLLVCISSVNCGCDNPLLMKLNNENAPNGPFEERTPDSLGKCVSLEGKPMCCNDA